MIRIKKQCGHVSAAKMVEAPQAKGVELPKAKIVVKRVFVGPNGEKLKRSGTPIQMHAMTMRMELQGFTH